MNTYFPPELQKKALSESLPSRKVHLLQGVQTLVAFRLIIPTLFP